MEKNRWHILDYIKIGIFGFPYPGLISIDVTYRCNLNCRHCYFKNQGYSSELSLEEWIRVLDTLKEKKGNLCICGWLGGEPLLRPEVIEEGKKYFKSNIIFTNGTKRLPDWKDCKFVVSIPGNEETYSEMTGEKKDYYHIVKEHANRSDIEVIVSYCITERNKHTIEPFVEEWKRDTKIKGIFFEFYTPFKESKDNLWVNWEERDNIIKKIKELKRIHGDFIYNTYQMLELMESRNIRNILKDCPFKYVGFSLDPLGKVKIPCTVGENADCLRCGCILPVFSWILYRRWQLFIAFVNGLNGTIMHYFKKNERSKDGER